MPLTELSTSGRMQIPGGPRRYGAAERWLAPGTLAPRTCAPRPDRAAGLELKVLHLLRVILLLRWGRRCRSGGRGRWVGRGGPILRRAGVLRV